MSSTSVYFYDKKPAAVDMASEVVGGLTASPKRLSPKFFYDEAGSQLFDQITQLPEYYVTRTEVALLQQHQEEISKLIGDECLLLEYGSGSSEKIKILLDALRPQAYMPLDISKEHLLKSAQQLSDEFSWLQVHATCVDYSRAWQLPWRPESARCVGFFPGSSIGNFDLQDAGEFLCQVRDNVGDDGGLLIGFDLRKDPQVLEAAYNDSQGVTAAFNLNVLTHINERLGSQINPEHFEHVAHYNEQIGRIEMHLRSNIDQIITVRDQQVVFKQGETVHTESSYKYTEAQINALAEQAGFKVSRCWKDPDDYFAVCFFEAL